MPDSPRLALARVARDVALADPDVATLDAGPSRLRITRMQNVYSHARSIL